jgi:hypothetical protein
MTFYNIATGQYLNECDFYALVKDTNYTCCSQSENVWIAQPNNLAFNEYQWQQYFLSHVPSCGSPYTLTLRYSAGNAPMQSLNDWNTQLAGNYTAVSVIGNDVILTGGSGVDIPASALIDSNLVQVTDDGSVNSMGDNCLAGGSIANLALSAAVSVGNGLLGNCPLSNIELPACTALGSTSGNDGIFTGISGQSISAIFNIALSTNNAGQPDGDILDLYANNDVTTQWDTAPVNTVAPAITGTNSVGSVLTCSTGTWTYLGDISYAYQWRRGGSPIGGATASTYTLVQADAAATIDCVVTATTSAGSTPATSSNSLYIYDTDANAFISAASITDNTQKTAVNKLVADLKGYSIWTKFKAIYPIVGGTAATHKWNLKDPQDTDAAFRLTFTSGWTHSANGMIPVNAYADTYLNANSILTLNSSHLSYYSRTNSNGTEVEIGTQNSGFSQFLIEIRTAGTSYYVVHQQSPYATSSDANSLGFYVANRTASNVVNGWKNGIKVATSTTTSTTKANLKIYIGAQNNAGTAGGYTTKQCAFASIGDGLTDTEAANLYTAVQAYQTTLGRNV